MSEDNEPSTIRCENGWRLTLQQIADLNYTDMLMLEHLVVNE